MIYAVGVKAGCEKIHKAITALTAADASKVVLQFDASNALNTMPRQRIIDSVWARAPMLAAVVTAWSQVETTHVYWDGDGTANPITSNRGVDQGCPLSPALFAIGIADALQQINDRIGHFTSDACVFSYLDDIIVAAPAGQARAIIDIVVEEMARAGLNLAPGKTVAWTRDPATALPPSVDGLRKDRLRCLGATAPWIDGDDPEGRLSVHSLADGDAAVRSAEAFVTKLWELRAAGLGAQDAFLLLQSYSHGHITHLLRANYEGEGWTRRFDEVILDALEHVSGEALAPDQQAQAFLRIKEGGLGLSSAECAREAAFLGSWGLNLKDTAALVNTSSWEDFFCAVWACHGCH